MEIERKYLLKQLPSNLDSYASKKIAQGYLCTSPVVRVRRSNDSYYMTYKGAGLMVREEYNLPLTKEAYDHLVQKIDGRLIEKTRYLYPFDGHIWEIDEFHGANEGLIVAEIELKSEDESYRLPPFIGKEVTDDTRYYNSNLIAHPYREWNKG